MKGKPVAGEDDEENLEQQCMGILSDLKRLEEHNNGKTIEGDLLFLHFIFLNTSIPMRIRRTDF